MSATKGRPDLFAAQYAHVCAVSITAPGSEISQLLGSLASEEVARAGRFHFDEDRKRFVIGRAMIRRLCATHLGIAPRDVLVEQTETGKPFVSGGSPRIEFNVSHSGDRVMLAWNLAGPIGIDVESVGRKLTQDFAEIAATVFSDEERAVLAESAQHEAAEVFFRIWVRKESLVKAEGCGIGGPLKEFSVVRSVDGKLQWTDELAFPGSERRWAIADLPRVGSHVSALAMPPGAGVVTVSPEDSGLLEAG